MEVPEYRKGRNFIRVGDAVKVTPSRKGKKDGFLGTVRAIHAAAVGPSGPQVVRVDVFGGPGKRVPALRSLTPDRLQRVAQSRNRHA